MRLIETETSLIHVAGRARARRRGRAIAGIAVASPSSRADEYRWPVIRVVDGDTLKVDADADVPASLAMLSVRIRGVDTPETHRPKYDAERRAGRAATAFVKPPWCGRAQSSSATHDGAGMAGA